MSGKVVGYIVAYVIGVLALVFGLAVAPNWMLASFGWGTLLVTTVLLIMGFVAQKRPGEFAAIWDQFDFDTPRGLVVLAIILGSYGLGFLISYLTFTSITGRAI